VRALLGALTTTASDRYDVPVTELEERVRALEAELSEASQKSDSRLVAVLLGRLGSNLEATGQRARAMEMLRRSVDLFEDLGDVRGLAGSLNRLGGAMSMEQAAEARLILERALETSRKANDRSAEATSLNNLAIIDEVAGNLNSSHAHYRRSIDLLRDVEDRAARRSDLTSLLTV
jgi:tetratricopeptide (TPR) repeat protein